MRNLQRSQFENKGRGRPAFDKGRDEQADKRARKIKNKYRRKWVLEKRGKKHERDGKFGAARQKRQRKKHFSACFFVL